jgi:rhamnose utilization protein RhaD (predicted bifunctional aldolase and dehydrogenase)/NAD(P)-dependent dehydrogenase (short-subunit alcohol dehydrogenase family)
MQNRWQDSEAKRLITKFSVYGEDLALCVYVSRLIGTEPNLVLHGGGNTSVKTVTKNLFGEDSPILFIKASGFDLENIGPNGFPAVELEPLRRMRELASLNDEKMMQELRRLLLNPEDPMPSVEAFLHAFIASKFVVHTHPASILALTNQQNADDELKAALGIDVLSVPYVRAGFGLAKSAADAFDQKPKSQGMILLQHGLVTWGESAKEAYAATIEIVNRAEEYWNNRTKSTKPIATLVDVERAKKQYIQIAPILRGLLAEPTGDQDHPYRRFVLIPWITPEVLDFLNHPAASEIATSAPLTPDHLIRTKATPLFVPNPNYSDIAQLRAQISSALAAYADSYQEYFERHISRLSPGARRFDPMPRVILLPGTGVICSGETERAAIIACDITAQSLTVKRMFALSETQYRALDEHHLFDMEYFFMQQAKLKSNQSPLERQVAIVTGAVGAIGRGITEALLENGCHVALADVAAQNLEKASAELKKRFPHQVFAVEMDVTDPVSVEDGFAKLIEKWGGVDLVIINAGVAVVSSISEMDIDAFKRLEKVNVEGTFLVLREASRIFRTQGTGGDIILISTKNVFAPGAKFGAYSATKAASHQLARIASLELAEIGVRVNMVAPDAVFSHGEIPSGLWVEVGPDRMKARGLDQKGLEEYYRNRNLLKARVTAQHVGRAVLFFATRQTPTTGATLPVDGGLPDATPR